MTEFPLSCPRADECKGCVYWGVDDLGSPEDEGVCRRHARWIPTPRDHWCGDFEARPTAAKLA